MRLHGLLGDDQLVADLEEPGPPLEIPGARVVQVEGPRQWLRFHRDDVSAAVIVARVADQVALKDLSLEEPAIDDVVRRIYAGATDDPARGGDRP